MQPNLSLMTDKPVFSGISFSNEDKAIIFGWVAETEIWNIIWIRLATIKWRWPPVKVVTAFTPRDD